MSRGYNLKKGFLFSYDWETATRGLPADEFYLLFWDLLDFQKSSGSVPFPIHQDHPNVNVIASLIIPQIMHRITCSRQSTNGVPTENGFELSEDKISEVDIKVSGDENSTAQAPLSAADKQMLLQRGIPECYFTDTERIQRAMIYSNTQNKSVADILSEWWKSDKGKTPNIHAKEPRSFDTDDFFEAAVRKSLEGMGVSADEFM